MATFKQNPKSKKWQAQVAIRGNRQAKTFGSKREAQAWAARMEYTIQNDIEKSNRTFADLLDRYAREVSPKKRGAKWEIVRLMRLKKDPISSIKLDDLSPSDFAAWRDRRLKEVAPASVNREMVLMSGALTCARREWQWVQTNMLSDVQKPSKPPARDRRVSNKEIQQLLDASTPDLSKAEARALHAFRFAIETGMRAGEIIGLRRDDVDLDSRVADLPMTKNGTARRVPLSKAAIEMLAALPDQPDHFFDLKSDVLDVLFRRVRGRTDIKNLKFHDSRHEAITRLSQKLEPLELARTVGHKNLNMLLVYYNKTAEELAQKLA